MLVASSRSVGVDSIQSMLEVSWGELAVVLGLGLALIGRKDLPNAARVAGTQVGRVVGLLQGARARADRFAAQNELKQLQNELRSGLRELDAVKAEVAVSMSGGGRAGGRTLGAMVPSANKQPPLMPPSSSAIPPITSKPNLPQSSTQTSTGNRMLGPASSFAPPTTNESPPMYSSHDLAPERQSIAAVVEEEWEKQGISFRSRAEQGAGLQRSSTDSSTSSTPYDVSTSGSVLLSNLIKETLIFDQYDRVTREQDQVLQSKMDSIQQKIAGTKSGPSRSPTSGSNPNTKDNDKKTS